LPLVLLIARAWVKFTPLYVALVMLVVVSGRVTCTTKIGFNAPLAIVNCIVTLVFVALVLLDAANVIGQMTAVLVAVLVTVLVAVTVGVLVAVLVGVAVKV